MMDIKYDKQSSGLAEQKNKRLYKIFSDEVIAFHMLIN
jgi:hypothetical protein